LRDLVGCAIQDGREDVRPLESHFCAWLVCTDQVLSFQVEGRDTNDSVLARISHEPYDRSQEQT
jgi:hypothetical protein